MYCISAIKKAREIVPDQIENGVMKKGVILRHLVLPSHLEDSKKILSEIKSNVGTDVNISLMSQYTPTFQVCNDKCLGRKVKKLEYKSVVAFAKKLGFKNGYTQSFESATCDFIPKFY